MKHRGTALALGALLFAGLIAWPYICRFVGMPARLASLAEAESQMAFIGTVIREYKAAHHGQVPGSYRALLDCVMADHEYDPEVHGSIAGGDLQYFPGTRMDKPLVSRYVPRAGNRSILLWIDHKGVLHESRVWLWPTQTVRQR